MAGLSPRIRPAWLVLGPGEHHESQWLGRLVGGAEDVVRTGDQRIVGVERDEHGAAALHGLVDAMVEELAEEREQAVVRRRQADVSGHVRDEQRLVRGTQPAGSPSVPPGVVGSVVHGNSPGLPWVLTGNPLRRPLPGWSTSGRR